VILQVVMADNPDFRYTVGKDAAIMLETKEICLIKNFKTTQKIV
jgi:hypothetical protein